MGLTVHYRLHSKQDAEDIGHLQARWRVEEARTLAKRMKRRGLVDAVGPLVNDRAALGLARQWVMYSVPGGENTFSAIEVRPSEGFLFVVRVGKDCEPLTLGLCRYPERVLHRGKSIPTKLGGGWRFAGFSKTQYASLHGREHFLRCHRAAIDLLAALRPLGFRVRINDEGEYWPRRSVTALRRNIGQMNALVAGAAGALKDMGDGGGVESAIFAHQDFERLEAEGAPEAGERLTVLPAIVKAAGTLIRPIRRNP
jgi:hypothetical protein